MISEQKLQNKIGWTPFKEQLKVLNCQNRERIICAGRRFGKSAICAYIALRTLLEGEAQIQKWEIGKEGKRPNPPQVWIVSPTYDLAEKVFNYVAKWFYIVNPEESGRISHRQGDTQIKQVSPIYTGFIKTKSAENPIQLKGDELDLLIIDEAAYISRAVFEDMYALLLNREGKAIYISTPFGQNWFWEKFVSLREQNAAFQFESRINPQFHPGHNECKEICPEWERLRKALPEKRFMQEYQASFLPEAASVLRIPQEIINDTCLEDSQEGHYYVMGVDLGKHEDFTVITIIDRKYKKVVYLDRFQKIDYTLQKKRIIAAARRYNNARTIVDSTGVGQPIKDDLEHEGILVDEFNFSGKSKKELVEKLSIMLEQKQITIPNDRILLDELTAYGYKLTEHGNVTYSAPQGLHDDCVMSLGLAVWGLNPGPPPRKVSRMEAFLEEKEPPRPVFNPHSI